MEKEICEFGSYLLVDGEADLNKAISELREYMKRNETMIAVDCEGISLSKKGQITVLITATREKVYLFDVLTIGKFIFCSGLKEILEDKEQEKLMFDYRQDSDALWYQFNVKLAGVLDL